MYRLTLKGCSKYMYHKCMTYMYIHCPVYCQHGKKFTCLQFIKMNISSINVKQKQFKLSCLAMFASSKVGYEAGMCRDSSFLVLLRHSCDVMETEGTCRHTMGGESQHLHSNFVSISCIDAALKCSDLQSVD